MGKGLKSRVNALPPTTTVDYRQFINSVSVPVISHEIGQWCVYPNFRERKKYTGYLKPKNFDIFYDRLQKQGMAKQADKFLLASGKLQTLLYKEEIESALRTPAMAGFQLLDLHDFPARAQRWWACSILLAGRDMLRLRNIAASAITPCCWRGWRSGSLPTPILWRPTSRSPISAISRCTIAPSMAAAGCTASHGSQRLCRLVIFPLTDAHPSGFDPYSSAGCGQSGQFQLVVSLQPGDIQNQWDVWIYPDQVSATIPDDVLVCNRIDEVCKAKLAQGGKVMLFIPPGEVKGDAKTGPIALGFSSIFWNTAWTSRQAPHTLGILCDPGHRALAEFPTDYHSNWQWWYLIHQAAPMIVSDLPKSLRPSSA